MKDLASLHLAEYEAPPDLICAAPGVVKLLGEQSESAEGLVLSMAISLEVRVSVSFRRDASLRFFAADLGERKRTSLANLKYKREDRWANHIKAVVERFIKEGSEARGLNFVLTGDIPPGLGLASSSAISLASAAALNELLGAGKKNEELAELVRKADGDFFGKAPGMHDLLTAACATPRSVTIVDLRSSRRRALPMLDGDWVLALTDSRVPRFSLDAELELRADDCKRCLAALGDPGKRGLRDVSPDEIEDLMGILPESVRRRCLHLAEEHRRVLEAEDALARGDSATFGKAVNKSHASLRNLYEISCPEIDWLQKRAAELEGVLCSRITGKGFGGCTVSVMRRDAVEEYRKRLEEYERIFGFKAQVFEAEMAGGLRVLA